MICSLSDVVLEASVGIIMSLSPRADQRSFF